jgi:hypothetical protein
MKKKKTPKPRAPSPVTLDRFEEELAVLIIDGREVTRPRSALPAGAREGDVLDPETLQVDAAATERLRAEVRQARERALEKKAPPPGDFDL